MLKIYFSLKFLLLIYVHGCFASMYVCTAYMCALGVCEGEKAPDSLKVELQVVVSPLCVLVIQSWFLEEHPVLLYLINLYSFGWLGFLFTSNLCNKDQARKQYGSSRRPQPLLLSIILSLYNFLFFYSCAFC